MGKNPGSCDVEYGDLKDAKRTRMFSSKYSTCLVFFVRINTNASKYMGGFCLVHVGLRVAVETAQKQFVPSVLCTEKREQSYAEGD